MKMDVAFNEQNDNLNVQFGSLLPLTPIGRVDDVQLNDVSIVDSDGIANIPVANNQLGAVWIEPDKGFIIDPYTGKLLLGRAVLDDIKTGTSEYRPVTPGHQHESVFYGLAKAAGDSTQSASANSVGTYTDEAKSAIRAMIGAAGETQYVNVPGSNITMTGENNVAYYFGELVELTFTPPQVGICAIQFTSGSTPTVVSLPGVSMPDSWEGAEANKVYEINILNGVGLYGVRSISV